VARIADRHNLIATRAVAATVELLVHVSRYLTFLLRMTSTEFRRNVWSEKLEWWDLPNRPNHNGKREMLIGSIFTE